MESEEQESNLTNPRMALVPGSAPFQSYNPSLDEREIFALVQYILFPLVWPIFSSGCAEAMTNTQWFDYPLTEGCGKISAFKICVGGLSHLGVGVFH